MGAFSFMWGADFCKGAYKRNVVVVIKTGACIHGVLILYWCLFTVTCHHRGGIVWSPDQIFGMPVCLPAPPKIRGLDTFTRKLGPNFKLSLTMHLTSTITDCHMSNKSFHTLFFDEPWPFQNLEVNCDDVQMQFTSPSNLICATTCRYT